VLKITDFFACAAGSSVRVTSSQIRSGVRSEGEIEERDSDVLLVERDAEREGEVIRGALCKTGEGGMGTEDLHVGA
jgi:hypothetical protein